MRSTVTVGGGRSSLSFAQQYCSRFMNAKKINGQERHEEVSNKYCSAILSV